MTTLRPFGPSVIFTALLKNLDPAQNTIAGVGGETDVFGSHCHSTPKEETRCEGPSGQPTTPRMSLSFMISRSSPSILTSVPDHFPKRMRSPALTSRG